MKHEKNRLKLALVIAAALIALACDSGSERPGSEKTSGAERISGPEKTSGSGKTTDEVTANGFTYVHVIGTGDPTPYDPHPTIVEMDETIAACDVGALTNSGLMTNVCSFDGDANSNGGVYHPTDGAPYRSFRREDSLPGQDVGFEVAIIPFGLPVLHPISGDTYLTAFFDPAGAGHSNLPGGREEGVYVYDFDDDTMAVIADTTTWSAPLPEGAKWTDFSTNVAVSEAGAFFVGDYVEVDGYERQGIYRYDGDQLIELLGDPASTKIPGKLLNFSKYRAVAANDTTVVFVGESCITGQSDCPKGVYAYRWSDDKLSTVIESDAPSPNGAIFKDFAVEPAAGIFHSSIAINKAGDIVLVARYAKAGRDFQGVSLLEKNGSDYFPVAILDAGSPEYPELLGVEIQTFNTVAINERSEIAFVVAKSDEVPAIQGLVFRRNAAEGLRSVFKHGDEFLAELRHSGVETTDHGAVVSGSQALDSSSPPRIFFRHYYKVDGVTYSMMALSTLHE